MKAYVFVNVGAGQSGVVMKRLRSIKGVKSADVCWGLPDIIALVEAADPQTLQGLVVDEIQKTPGVSQTDTHIVWE